MSICGLDKIAEKRILAHVTNEIINDVSYMFQLLYSFIWSIIGQAISHDLHFESDFQMISFERQIL